MNRFTHTDRLLSRDTQPCETEQPEDYAMEYQPDPIAKGTLFSAAVAVVCFFLAFVLAVVVWLIN